MSYLKNFHVLHVTYVGPIHDKGSKVKIYSNRFDESISIPYDHEFSTISDTAQNYLEKLGFEFIGKAESKQGYFLISLTFKSLKK